MFKHEFLKYKNYFLASWILQRVCKFQRVLANIPKIQKSFLGIRLYSLIKKSQMGIYPKYY